MTPKLIRQPDDAWEAWQAQADEHTEGNLAEFIWQRVNQTLPAKVRKELGPRTKPGRPREE